MSKKFSHIGQAFMLPIAILPVAGLPPRARRSLNQ